VKTILAFMLFLVSCGENTMIIRGSEITGSYKMDNGGILSVYETSMGVSLHSHKSEIVVVNHDETKGFLPQMFLNPNPNVNGVFYLSDVNFTASNNIKDDNNVLITGTKLVMIKLNFKDSKIIMDYAIMSEKMNSSASKIILTVHILEGVK